MIKLAEDKERMSPRANFEEIACVHCKNTHWKSNESAWTCLSCKTIYPVLFGYTPVLMPRAREHITKTYLQFRQYLLEQQQRAQELEKAVTLNSYRKEQLALLLRGQRHNSNLLYSLQEQLSKELLPGPDLIEYLHTQPAAALRYTTNFDYLRRDWTGLPEGELELREINTSLNKAISFVKPKCSKVVVLGAGMGRVAYDLCSSVDQVIALDQSISMGAWFHKIAEEDLTFYEINPKNTQYFEDRVRPLRARMPDKNHLSKLFYGIADAQQLPLASQSVDAVISVYFTDLLPLKKLLPEVKRVLRPGGAFIHFGPLHYHFDDTSQMLSFEEVKKHLQSKNFTIALEERQKTTHCGSAASCLQKFYLNWNMVAIKREEPKLPPLKEDSVLYIPQKVSYQVMGHIGHGVEEQFAIELNTPGKNFEGAETILDVLRLIDGQKSLLEVCRGLEQIYGTFEQSEVRQLIEILEQLRKDGVIACKVIPDNS